jgi:hypothetical protein
MFNRQGQRTLKVRWTGETELFMRSENTGRAAEKQKKMRSG